MPGSPSFLYRTFFKRESTWIGFILAGAIVAEVATDGITNAVWRAKNSGVRNLKQIVS